MLCLAAKKKKHKKHLENSELPPFLDNQTELKIPYLTNRTSKGKINKNHSTNQCWEARAHNQLLKKITPKLIDDQNKDERISIDTSN